MGIFISIPAISIYAAEHGGFLLCPFTCLFLQQQKQKQEKTKMEQNVRLWF